MITDEQRQRAAQTLRRAFSVFLEVNEVPRAATTRVFLDEATSTLWLSAADKDGVYQPVAMFSIDPDDLAIFNAECRLAAGMERTH